MSQSQNSSVAHCILAYPWAVGHVDVAMAEQLSLSYVLSNVNY